MQNQVVKGNRMINLERTKFNRDVKNNRKAEKIAKALAGFNSVSYRHLPNSSRFKMISANGVDWSERSTK